MPLEPCHSRALRAGNRDAWTRYALKQQAHRLPRLYSEAELLRNALLLREWRDLANACDSGNIEVVTTLLSRVPRWLVDKGLLGGSSSYRPLCIASRRGHVAIVKALLDANAEVDGLQEDWQMPEIKESSLSLACGHGHIEIVTILLDANAEVNQAFSFDSATPLFTACEEGHTEIVVKLLDAKADVNQADEDGRTPLIVACQPDWRPKSHKGVITVLLAAGADDHIGTRLGQGHGDGGTDAAAGGRHHPNAVVETERIEDHALVSTLPGALVPRAPASR